MSALLHGMTDEEAIYVNKQTGERPLDLSLAPRAIVNIPHYSKDASTSSDVSTRFDVKLYCGLIYDKYRHRMERTPRRGDGFHREM